MEPTLLQFQEIFWQITGCQMGQDDSEVLQHMKDLFNSRESLHKVGELVENYLVCVPVFVGEIDTYAQNVCNKSFKFASEFARLADAESFYSVDLICFLMTMYSLKEDYMKMIQHHNFLALN